MKNKLIYLGLCLSLVACGGNNSTSKLNSPSSNSSSLNNDSVITGIIEGPTLIGVGDLVVYTLNSSSTAKINWESSDRSVLEINSKGEAIAWKEGFVVISALDANNNVISLMEVTVENKINYPTNEMELYNLLTSSMELEHEASDIKIEKKSSSISQVYSKTVKVYDDFYISLIDDEYNNHTGYNHEISTNYYGIKDGYFYDISDSSAISYGIKRKIVKANPTDYEIVESQALERIQDPNCINLFVSYLADIWGARTLGLNIEVEEKDDSFVLKLSNTYLFVWADGVSNDSKYYEATLEFSNDCFLLNGYFKATTYIDNQYNVSENKFFDNPEIKETQEYKFVATRGAKHNNSENTFIPEEYFVTSVTKAKYNDSLIVGSRINVDKIELEEYEGSKSLDYTNILIKGIQNDGDNVVVAEDTSTGGYVCISSGTAYLVCQMMYSPEVIFLVEIEVMEG